MRKKHDFDSGWKTILEAFEREIVELLFPEIYEKVDWSIKSESLDNELREIQKDIFDKNNTKKIISDKIIKLHLKDDTSKIIFIHAEVQSYNDSEEIFGERMFKYFYRIWDKFKNRQKDKSEIVAAAIYTYSGKAGKDERFVYKVPGIKEDILTYNFRTIDVESIDLLLVSDDNPLKLVFIIGKELLKIGTNDQNIYEAKIKLATMLNQYEKVKNREQIRALANFLEYLFLIENKDLENKYIEFKNKIGGNIKMSISEIEKIHYTEEGREEGREEGKIKIAENLLDVLDDETISIKTGLDVKIIKELRKK